MTNQETQAEQAFPRPHTYECGSPDLLRERGWPTTPGVHKLSRPLLLKDFTIEGACIVTPYTQSGMLMAIWFPHQSPADLQALYGLVEKPGTVVEVVLYDEGRKHELKVDQYTTEAGINILLQTEAADRQDIKVDILIEVCKRIHTPERKRLVRTLMQSLFDEIV